jgi:polysaccharide export outer membrane protein
MTRKNKFGLLLSFGVFFLVESCGVNSNIMFKSPKGEYANSDSIPMKPLQDYQISIDDKLTFTLATNNGTKIIESMSGINQQGLGAGSGSDYAVRRTGNVELPILGEVKVAGLTVAQCEDTLQRLFSKEYQEPFVQVKITNQRVIVFPGNGGDARVIPLLNSNTTLMEAIAQAGGITERGKANTIKLMRKESGIRKVYTFDLSTVEGLKYVDMIVQANDYIYIEPSADLAQGVVREVAPVISILSSALVIFTVFSNIK